MPARNSRVKMFSSTMLKAAHTKWVCGEDKKEFQAAL